MRAICFNLPYTVYDIWNKKFGPSAQVFIALKRQIFFAVFF